MSSRFDHRAIGHWQRVGGAFDRHVALCAVRRKQIDVRRRSAESIFPDQHCGAAGNVGGIGIVRPKRGSFTGAVQDKRGWLEDCPPLGAVFLDEIGDLDLAIQVKLLRVIETRSFQAVGEGSAQLHKFEGKLIAATNQNLERAIRKRTFREDLYYRLCSEPYCSVRLLHYGSRWMSRPEC